MSIMRRIGHAAGALVITGVAGASLAAPAVAIVIPCDPQRAGDCTSAIPQTPGVTPTESGIAVEELVLGALGGAAVAGAGVGAVLAVRRRTPVAPA